MVIKVCVIQGLAPFGTQKKGYDTEQGKFWLSETYSSHKPMVRSEIKVCANIEVPGIINDPASRGHNFV